jgi:hypothetical protein
MIFERSCAETFFQALKPLSTELERAVEVGLVGPGERADGLAGGGVDDGCVRPARRRAPEPSMRSLAVLVHVGSRGRGAGLRA